MINTITQPDPWFQSFDFEPYTTKFSFKNALALAKASRLAYYTDAAFVNQVARENFKFDHVYIFDREQIEALLLADREKIIVAFRGTDSLKNWMDNLDIDLVGGPFGRVHEGFSRGLSWVWREVQGVIQDLQVRQRISEANFQSICENAVRPPSLWITGHSLGGALATLATAKLREKDRPVSGLYTFGSPRVGDREFERNFNTNLLSKTYRFVNRNDLVTRIPLRSLFYSHVGQLVYFDYQDVAHNDPSFWYRFLDGIRVRIEDLLDLDLSTLENHELVGYLRALRNNQNRRWEELD